MSGLFERLTGLVLLDPAFLVLALLVPLAVWLGRRGGAPAVHFAPFGLLGRGGEAGEGGRDDEGVAVPRSLRQRLLPLPRVLFVAGLLLVVVALARPARREPLPLRSEGLDILLCLDTSSSMTAKDMDPERARLEVAKDAATAFVGGRPEDRIGLVTFARYADLRCPLTKDHRALERILADVETVEGDGPEDATGIGTAAARAAQVLRDGGSRAGVVILLTDGEENVALEGVADEIPPTHAAQLARQLDVKVYGIVVGVGRRDASGDWVRLDTRAVEAVAERTGGAFFEARNAGAVASVYARIDRLEKAPFEEPRYTFEDVFVPFLLAAVLLLLASRLLQVTWLDVLP